MITDALTAALLGVLASSALVIGALLALWLRPSNRMVGLIMGFGAGALISALAYELVEEAISASARVGLGLALGALVYFAGDWLVDRRGGQDRKDIAGGASSGSGQAIFLGTLLDGIPESFVLGTGFALGKPVGGAFLIAVFISNLPEAMAATASLESAGRTPSGILIMWLWLVLGSAIAAAAGYFVVLVVPSGRGRVCPGIRRRRSAHNARGCHDAGSLSAWRPGGRPDHSAGIRRGDRVQLRGLNPGSVTRSRRSDRRRRHVSTPVIVNASQVSPAA